ncbi:MAG: hypothetical protein AAFX93_19095 [Verrucomicrobiota bacterium]
MSLVATCVLSLASAYAATHQVGPGWAYQLQNKINQAAPGDTIKLTGDIRMGKAVTFNKANLTLDGQGYTIFDDFNGNTFQVRADGVTIKNTKFQGSTNRNWRGFIVGYDSVGLTISGCTFNSGMMGLMLPHTPPRNLNFKSNTFNSVWYAACWHGREVLAVPGSNDDAKFARATQAGPLYIDDNQLYGDFQGGLRFDCGNDGNYTPASNPNHPLRFRVMEEPTRFAWFGRSYVRNNTVSGNRRFGIGFARGAGVTIQGNRMIISATPDNYIEAIHFENQSANMDLFDNHVTISHVGSNPAREISGFGLVSFTDHGAPPRFKWGCKNILVGWGNRVDKKWPLTNGIGLKAQNVTNGRFNYLNMSAMTSPSRPYAMATHTENGWNKPQDRWQFTFTQVGNNPVINF